MELKDTYLVVLNGLVGNRNAAPENISREAMRIAKAAIKEWKNEHQEKEGV